MNIDSGLLTLENDARLQQFDGRAFKPDEGRRLAYLASLVPQHQAIVEVGSYRGKSTIFLASSAKAHNRPMVYAVDIWDLGHDELLNTPSVYKEFLQQIGEADVSNFVHPIKGDSASIAALWTLFNGPQVGLLWIDGAHDYESVRRDIIAWVEKLVVGGWIAFHDYGTKRWPGVKRAIEHVLLPTEMFDDIQVHETVWSARRVR